MHHMSELTGNEKMVLSGAISNKLFWEHAIELAGVEKPKIVIDTTAAPDDRYRNELKDVTAVRLGELFGATVTLLNPLDAHGRPTTPAHGRELIATSDILYPCGGDTKALLDEWNASNRFTYVERMLRAGELTLVGASAGSLIWFERGFSDYKQYRTDPGRPWNYATLNGRGLLPGWGNVHHSDRDNIGRYRKAYFEPRYSSSKDTGSAISLDFYAGVMLADGKLTALDLLSETMPQDGAHAVYHYKNNYVPTRRVIEPGETITL